MTDKTLTRRNALKSAAFGGASLLLAGAAGTARAAGEPVRVGFQRYSTLIVTRKLGLLEKALAPLGIDVVWSEFVAGPQLLQALGANAIDLGQTGDAPPIFAEAAAPDSLVYVGYEPPSTTAEAIIVPGDSPIRTVADLKGKRVALNRGSNVHWFLLAALKKYGLTFADIHPVYLTPPAARAAFDGGQLDAWAIWDPYLSSALDTKPRVLTTAEGIVANREFFLASRDFATRRSNILKIVADVIAQTDIWVNAHLDDVARLLSDATGIPYAAVQHDIRQRTFGFHVLDPQIIAEQQTAADALYQAHLLPRPVRIADSVWTPPK